MKSFILFFLLLANLGLSAQDAILDLGQGATLSFYVAKFDSNAHDIELCKVQDWISVCLIDGNPVFGTDTELPQSTLKRLILEWEGKKIDLEVTAMYNPYFSKAPSERLFKLMPIEGGHDLRGFFSDGAGAYVAHWRIIHGHAFRTVLSDDERHFE